MHDVPFFLPWQFNADNQQVLQTDPTGGTTVTTYNADGQAATVTDPDGRTKTYTYDNDGNLTQEVWKASSGTVVDTLSDTEQDFGASFDRERGATWAGGRD